MLASKSKYSRAKLWATGLLLLLSTTFGCKPKQPAANQQSLANTYWINVSYLHCLGNQSPCYCFGEAQPVALHLWNGLNRLTIYNDAVEPEIFEIAAAEDGFQVVENRIQTIDTTTLRANAASDSLFYKNQTFIEIASTKSGIISNVVGRVNAMHFKKRFPAINRHLELDSFRLLCSPSAHKHYLLSDDCANGFQVVYLADSINIYHITNLCAQTPENNTDSLELLLTIEK